MSDPRFARLRNDPRFRKPKKNSQKVVVDERFKSLLGGQKSAKKTKERHVDKYGRHISRKHENDDLKRFYRLQDEQPKTGTNEQVAPKLVDYARGEVLLESSDEEEEKTDEEGVESDENDDAEVVLGQHASKPIHVLGGEDELLEVDLNEDEDAYAALDIAAAAYAGQHGFADAEESTTSGSQTNRIAIVNLDWDHVRASHLYKIFSSLVSPTAPAVSLLKKDGQKENKAGTKSGATIARGRVLSVQIFRSEFGKERLKKEEVEGPPKEIFKRNIHNEDDGPNLIEEDDGAEYNEDALRKYQLERLRYYYAIVTCDTIDAAAHCISELDGTELERSANVFDLSFVPEGMDFSPSDMRDEATPMSEDSKTQSNFKGLDFSTDALRHSKVTLKWDEDDPERNKITRRALTKQDIEDGNFKALIASSESEYEDDDAAIDKSSKKSADRDRLRGLLLGGSTANDKLPEGWGDTGFSSDSDGDKDMEITFMPGLSAAAKSTGDETTLEKYKRKQKEKREARKAKATRKEPGAETKDKKVKKQVDDDFFAAGSSSEDDRDEIDDDKEREERRPATAEELALLLAPDNADGVLAALEDDEKPRKKKGKKGKGKKRKPEEDADDAFQVDVTDDRFKALHEDHRFSIDPSNPQFKRTKGMDALLIERSKQSSGKKGEHIAPQAGGDADGPTESLQSLVDSVKRKSKHGDKGSGKRRKL